MNPSSYEPFLCPRSVSPGLDRARPVPPRAVLVGNLKRMGDPDFSHERYEVCDEVRSFCIPSLKLTANFAPEKCDGWKITFISFWDGGIRMKIFRGERTHSLFVSGSVAGRRLNQEIRKGCEDSQKWMDWKAKILKGFWEGKNPIEIL